MSLTHLYPVNDDDEHIVAPRASCDPPPPVTATDEPSRPGRVLAWSLVVLSLALAASAAVWWVFLSPRAAAAEAPISEPSRVIPPTGISGFAELYVATYLTSAGDGAEEALAAFSADELDVGGMAPHSHYVTRAEAIAIDPHGDGYWTATVAAEVLVLSGDGYLPDGLQFYIVGVIEAEGGFAAVGLPARIAPPQPPRVSGVARVEADLSTEQELLAAGFLDAYLTGGSEIGRFLTPESELEAVRPAPYATIEITGAGTATVDDQTYLHADVTATTPTGQVHNMEYTLELVHNSRVWLVHALHAGPPQLPPHG